jgi:hypothetical protein
MTTTYVASVTALCDALEGAYGQLAATMRQITDPRPRAVGTWSIGETALHVAGSGGYFLGSLRGDVELVRLDEVAAHNAGVLAGNPERDPQVLVERMTRDGEALVAYARQISGDPPSSPFAGFDVPTSSTLAIELGELLVHGYDIARAAGLPWEITSADAVLTLEASLPVFPYLLDLEKAAGVRLAIDLRVRGSRPVVIRIEDQSLAVDDYQGQPVDLHVSTDPVAYLLLIWNRIPPWKPLLRGQLLIWGRRPWRMAELATLLQIA